MSHPAHFFPVTNTNVLEVYEYTFPPWTKQLGLCDFSVREGYVSARFPRNEMLRLSSGVLSGQALMAAIDTVAALAISTTTRMPRGTIYQHTHFVRPAANDDFSVVAEVLRFGKIAAYVEIKVWASSSSELVAHAAAEFAF